MASGRQADKVLELRAYILIHNHKPEKRLSENSMGFWNLKAHPH